MRLLAIFLFLCVLGVNGFEDDATDNFPVEKELAPQEDADGELDERGLFSCGWYNVFTKRCCDGKVYVRKTHGCCDGKVYVEKTHDCCGETVIKESIHGCCDGKKFSKRYEKCCDGVVKGAFFTKKC